LNEGRRKKEEGRSKRFISGLDSNSKQATFGGWGSEANPLPQSLASI
jgi:hypothetical protein